VIDRDAFLEVIKSIDDEGLSEGTQAIIQPLVQVNPNHGHIFQAKMVLFLFDEANAKWELTKSNNTNVQQTKNGGQVLSFKQLESDDEQ